MQNEFSDIEAALSRLQPKVPSEFCRARISQALEEASLVRHKRWLHWLGAAAAVAGIGCVFVLGFQGSENPSQVIVEEPISENSAPAAKLIVSDVEPLEIQQAPDGRFFRPYRVRYLQTTNAEAGEHGTTLLKSVPSEEIQFVPVDII